jgi:GNAT superfamily N-acetyltransferase
MSDPTLRYAEIVAADVPELTRVMTAAFDDDARRHLGLPKGGPPGYDNGDFFREWLFGRPQTVGYKVLLGSRIVGGVVVWVYASGENTLGTIFIDPDYQNRGIGARTWAFVESTFPGARRWLLETPGFSTSNHRFYEKCGFRRIAVKPPAGGVSWETWVYAKEVCDGHTGSGSEDPAAAVSPANDGRPGPGRGVVRRP